jgi:hypothetical protein
MPLWFDLVNPPAPLAAAWPRALVAQVGALTGFSDPMDAWTSVGLARGLD